MECHSGDHSLEEEALLPTGHHAVTNLVLTDILMLLICLPIITVTGIAGEYLVGNTNMMCCQFCSAEFIGVALMMNSLFAVALISLDCLLFTYKPLENERKATP